MFTGIVKAVGRVVSVGTGSGGARRLTIDTGAGPLKCAVEPAGASN